MPRKNEPTNVSDENLPKARVRIGRTQPSSIDVAKLAGVSQSAVSRSFTEGASVSEKTKKKVMEAARKLGYKPSILPRILVTHRSQLVAIVIGGMYNPYYAEVFETFTRRLQEEGYQVLVFFVDHNEYFDEAIPIIMKYRVDAVISALSLLSPDAAAECEQMEVPVVLFNGKRQNKYVSSVCCDNAEGGRTIANLFHSKGAKSFAYISGKETLANTDRQQGFIGRLAELDVEDVRVVEGDFKFDGGYTGAKSLFSDGPAPDAIFCANDLTAIGAMEYIRHELQLSVPDDVMVAGFDDAVFSEWPSVGVTTIRQHRQEMVDKAIDILKRQWSGDAPAQGALTLVPGTLVERASTDRSS